MIKRGRKIAKNVWTPPYLGLRGIKSAYCGWEPLLEGVREAMLNFFYLWTWLHALPSMLILMKNDY